MDQQFTAAMIVIGNEILSGRTQDKNINYLANKLVENGIALSEVRIVPDLEYKIIETINEMRAQYDYVVTSGGIGPTHDDITASCVAKAFQVAFGVNDQAYQILLDHYGEAEFNEARQRMALIPSGASLIPNPVSAAPGFIIENVHVMAGVPRIFQAMVDHVVMQLKGGAVVQARTVECTFPESKIALGLADIQARYDSVDIGSYPHFKDNRLGVNVVLRSTDDALLDKAEQDVVSLLDDLGQT